MNTGLVIIVAMESERCHLDLLAPGWEKVSSPVWPTWKRNDAICIVCGIGMIAAAAATEYAIATYSPAFVLNYGCTGAHHPELFPGDVVIGKRLIHQGRMRFAADGSIIPLEVGFQVPGEADVVTELACDTTLVAMAESISATLDLPTWPIESRLASQPHRKPLVYTGTVSSGDIWLQSTRMISAGHERTGSLCEDMEAASIGQICALHNMPFLTVKDISNSELHENTVFEGSSSDLPSHELGLRAAMVISGVMETLTSIGRGAKLPYS